MVGAPLISERFGGGRVTEELLRAASQGELDTVARYLGLEASVDCCDQNGFTPLLKAAAEGHLPVVQLVLKKGAVVNHQDSLHGNAALHEACWKGFSETAEALVKSRADVSLRNRGGFAPLHLACQNGHNQTCRVLLLAGCKPDIKNNYGDTPLHTAARYGHAGVTRILLSALANVKESNKNGDSGLHIAAAMGRKKLTKMLLEAGADQTIRNKQGETAEDIATRKNYAKILDTLRNPPPVLSIEERLQRERQRERSQKEAKEGTQKQNKKRDKLNDSGTSSRGSGPKRKEKKMKEDGKIDPKTRCTRISSWGVDWSPYGCYVTSANAKAIPKTKLESLPKEPLTNGEQYFVDLAGNIKKGPIGVGAACYCAPLFRTVQTKMEKDKLELMDHIDEAHGKLNAKISSLGVNTRGHIQKLGDTVQEKFALERAECQAQGYRLKRSQDVALDKKVAQLQMWLEKRLSNHHPDSPTSMRRRFPPRYKVADSVRGEFPLTRSRSEEAISEFLDYSCGEEPLYKGLRVLDHPTSSMYNIYTESDMSNWPGAHSLEERSNWPGAHPLEERSNWHGAHPLEERHLAGENVGNASMEVGHLQTPSCKTNQVSIDPAADVGQTLPTSSNLMRPRNRLPLVSDSVTSSNFPADVSGNRNTDGAALLGEAVGNLNVTEDDSGLRGFPRGTIPVYNDQYHFPCIPESDLYMWSDGIPGMAFVPSYPEGFLSSQYTHMSNGLPYYVCPADVSNGDHNASTYLNMDRCQMPTPLVRSIDEANGEACVACVQPPLKSLVLETSTEQDSHNDSGYSTRLCSASQEPSPSRLVFSHLPSADDMRRRLPNTSWQWNGRGSSGGIPGFSRFNVTGRIRRNQEVRPSLGLGLLGESSLV